MYRKGKLQYSRAKTLEKRREKRSKENPIIIINQVKRYEKAERIEKNRSREERQMIAGQLGQIDKINKTEEKTIYKT